MDFFSGLGKKFTDVAKTVSEKTKSGVETGKLNLEVKAKKDEISKLFEKLGKSLYDNRDIVPEMEEIVLKIDALKEEIAKLSEQIDKINNVRRCPSCGKAQTRDGRFCANCGAAMPEDPVEEPVVEESAPAEEKQPCVCPDCGAEVEGEAKFCTVCGKNLEEPAAECCCEGECDCEDGECCCDGEGDCDCEEGKCCCGCDCEEEPAAPAAITDTAEEPNEEETAED